jgi:hypothetical protein
MIAPFDDWHSQTPGVRPRVPAGAKGSGMGTSTNSRKRPPGGPQAPAKPGPENTAGQEGALQITNGPEWVNCIGYPEY